MPKDLKSRLAQFIDHLGISRNEFGRKIGHSSAFVSQVLSGTKGMGVDKFEKIVSAFPEVNPDWLLTGKGSMLKSTISTVAEPAAEYGIQARSGSLIHLVDQTASAGYGKGYKDEEWVETLPSLSLPGYKGNYRAFEVSGDSMHPTLFSGDWVICAQLEKLDLIRDNYVYVVVAEDGVMVKRVLNRVKDKQALMMKSDNEFYPTYPVSAKQIREVWQVKARLTAQIPGKDTIWHSLDELTKRFEKLEGIVETLKGKS